MLLIINKNAGAQLNIALSGFPSDDGVEVPFDVVMDVVVVDVFVVDVVGVSLPFSVVLSVVMCPCSSLFNTSAAFAVNIMLSRGTVSLKIYTDLQSDL